MFIFGYSLNIGISTLYTMFLLDIPLIWAYQHLYTMFSMLPLIWAYQDLNMVIYYIICLFLDIPLTWAYQQYLLCITRLWYFIIQTVLYYTTRGTIFYQLLYDQIMLYKCLRCISPLFV